MNYKKILFFITNLLLTHHTWAQAKEQSPYQLYCSGNRGKVLILFEQVNDKIRFTYTNTEGKKEFPIYEGVVTDRTMPFLKFAKKELDIIDSRLVLEWKIEQCKTPTKDSMIITCDGEAAVIYPTDSNLTSFDVFTSRINEQTPSFKFETFKINLGLDSKNMHYLISMPFDPAQCEVKSPENFKFK